MSKVGIEDEEVRDGWYLVSNGYYQLWDEGVYVTECSEEFVGEVIQKCGVCFPLHLGNGVMFED